MKHYSDQGTQMRTMHGEMKNTIGSFATLLLPAPKVVTGAHKENIHELTIWFGETNPVKA
jgi:hypothetical protein